MQFAYFDLDLVGLDIAVNGRVIKSSPPPFGDVGVLRAVIPWEALVKGDNTVSIRAKSEGPQVEDFEFDGLKVIVRVRIRRWPSLADR